MRVSTGQVDCGSETAPCNTVPCFCSDYPNWKSSSGTKCSTYQSKQFCFPNATYGPGWLSSYGTFGDFKNFGLDATEACCACGREQVLCNKYNVQCQNGGTCHSGICFCINGYGGDQCELGPCQLKDRDLREQNLKFWTSADEPACDIEKAVDFLAEYSCTRQDGCQIVTCEKPVPQEKFTKLSNCDLSI